MAGNQRFKDVLLALGATASRGMFLHRIQLQKFIYLQDVFAAVWREVAKPAKFQPYTHGPYDKDIQNAVDALAFRGLVEICNVDINSPRKIRSSYRLTGPGKKLIETLISNAVLKQEFLLAEEIASEIDRRGWRKIVSMVYSEPTFVTARNSANRRMLRTNDSTVNITTQIVRQFQSAWAQTSENSMSTRCFVQIAFLVFDRYRMENPFPTQLSIP